MLYLNEAVNKWADYKILQLIVFFIYLIHTYIIINCICEQITEFHSCPACTGHTHREALFLAWIYPCLVILCVIKKNFGLVHPHKKFSTNLRKSNFSSLIVRKFFDTYLGFFESYSDLWKFFFKRCNEPYETLFESSRYLNFCDCKSTLKIAFKWKNKIKEKMVCKLSQKRLFFYICLPNPQEFRYWHNPNGIFKVDCTTKDKLLISN